MNGIFDEGPLEECIFVFIKGNPAGVGGTDEEVYPTGGTHYACNLGLLTRAEQAQIRKRMVSFAASKGFWVTDGDYAEWETTASVHVIDVFPQDDDNYLFWSPYKSHELDLKQAKAENE